MSKNRDAHCSMDQHIDRVRLCESDRQIAKAHMRDADVMVETVGRAIERVRSAWVVIANSWAARAR